MEDRIQAKETLNMRSYKFKKVTQFKYLSTMIIQSNNKETEILKRV